ncbi:MAG: FAD-dependent oxidoreductase [Mongoliibacter sp.]|uniref:NAD(P)/FAD-dependent oxidoreductase n=1 Tax=Mongoliibacter sp. TaxID=2022438 RepID=UPI0012F1F423|nr:NAD(P)/FAD-dependent oxidoreductase [Mongoliibacter sp.]TVP51430.1 MAG: FAD-dependent oxidoreductase [Mongoliibacter sp.]
MKKESNIYIIGAGVSGLVAAFELEKSGLSPVILEASDEVGGRVRTDKVDGFLLDRGFQVLLTAYPEAQRYLDYDLLNLKNFDPGAIILKPGNSFSVHDPLRNPSKAISMAFSAVGTLKDKIKIFQLTQELKKKSDAEIFTEPNSATLQYLQDYGFSVKIIDNFFKPFFKGIFLENDLSTSSRMFKFVFKMFSQGHAAIPEKGMQMIPEQLRNKLKTTKIRFNEKVKSLQGTQIELESGEILEADAVIVACRPDLVIPQLKGQIKPYRKVVNIYYSLSKSFIAQPMIGLLTGEQFIVNNLVFLTDVSKSYAENDRALLSVSITKPVAVDEKLEKLIAIELSALTNINAEFFEHVKTYEIYDALPDVEEMAVTLPATSSKIFDNVFLAGDHLLYGSLNAAMTSGRKAAEALILSLQPVY